MAEICSLSKRKINKQLLINVVFYRREDHSEVKLNFVCEGVDVDGIDCIIFIAIGRF